MFVNICYNLFKNLNGHFKLKGEGIMSILVTDASKTVQKKSKFNDEFENYLKKQYVKTTFNGLELETFTWYRKVLGLV